MGDHSKLTGRYWPTRQQLVVVCGEPALVTQWFDANREHHEAVRDVLDLWAVQPIPPTGPWVRALGQSMERMRHTLHQVRQWDVET